MNVITSFPTGALHLIFAKPPTPSALCVPSSSDYASVQLFGGSVVHTLTTSSLETVIRDAPPFD